MPNFVLLMSDEHNPFYSSVYGHTLLQTENMALLASRGTVYENAYCPSPLCLPSRSAFLSGRHVHQLQTYNNCTANLDPHILSFGAALAEQSFHIAYIGKTDVYAPGDRLGFSEMILPGDRTWPGDTKIRRQPGQTRAGAAERANRYGPLQEGASRDQACIDAAVDWIRRRGCGDDPWGLVLNVTLPHFPQFASPDLWERYAAGVSLPLYGRDEESANHPYALDLRAYFETDQFSQEQIRGLCQGYLACVEQVDAYLGQIIDALDKSGQLAGTNLIYTSDHGEMLGKFGMWWKCSLYEESVRIPCIACGPDFAAGQRVRTPVSLHDVRATLFHSLRVDQPAGWLGRPLSSLPDDDQDRVVFSEYHGHGTRASAYMVRQGHWKYIYYIAADDQLFDLEHDPHELANVIGDKPSIARELRESLQSICSPEKENDRAEAFIQAQLDTAFSASDRVG